MIAGTETDGSKGSSSSPGKLLIVDDDAPLRRNLVRAMERLGYAVATAGGVREAYEVAAGFSPDYAVIDLNLSDGHGMELIESLSELRPGLKIVVLTGYDSIASSIVATKAGAVGYLAKPVKPEDLAATLAGETDPAFDDDNPMSADRVRWEHIQRVFEQCNRNVSETARRLHMHAATLAGETDPAFDDDNPMSADRVRWEHIQRVFEQCNRNVSETARRLNMHRRTLQRILSKRAPRP